MTRTGPVQAPRFAVGTYVVAPSLAGSALQGGEGRVDACDVGPLRNDRPRGSLGYMHWVTWSSRHPAWLHTEELEPSVSAVVDLITRAWPTRPQPVDGDCLVWTPRVVQVLNDAGYPARAATVTGWGDLPQRCIAFMHRVALVHGGLVVDVTARQFDISLPFVWVTSTAEYSARLAAATGVASVAVDAAASAAAPNCRTCPL